MLDPRDCLPLVHSLDVVAAAEYFATRQRMVYPATGVLATERPGIFTILPPPPTQRYIWLRKPL